MISSFQTFCFSYFISSSFGTGDASQAVMYTREAAVPWWSGNLGAPKHPCLPLNPEVTSRQVSVQSFLLTHNSLFSPLIFARFPSHWLLETWGRTWLCWTPRRGLVGLGVQCQVPSFLLDALCKPRATFHFK